MALAAWRWRWAPSFPHGRAARWSWRSWRWSRWLRHRSRARRRRAPAGRRWRSSSTARCCRRRSCRRSARSCAWPARSRPSPRASPSSAVGLRRWCGARDMFVEMPATLNVHVFTCCEPATRLALEISQKIEIRGGSGAICFSFGIFCPVPDPLPLEVDGRYHAFEKAHRMDPRSAGRGVRQFKIALLQRLEQDNKSTFSKRKEKNDGREIKSFYEKKKQVNAHELMPVLAEVLKALLIGTGGASGRFADRGADETPLAPVWKTSSPDSSCLAEIWRTAVGSCGGWRRLIRSKRNKAGGIPISLIRGTAMETAVRGEATRLRRTPDPVAATTGWSVAAAVQDNGSGIER